MNEKHTFMKLSSYAVSLNLFILLLMPSIIKAQSSWRQVTFPTVREAAASFAKPL